MGKTRPPYPQEFRDEIVELVQGRICRPLRGLFDLLSRASWGSRPRLVTCRRSAARCPGRCPPMLYLLELPRFCGQLSAFAWWVEIVPPFEV